MYQDWYEVPALYSADRAFIKNILIAWLISFLELWLIDGAGDLEDVEDVIVTAHFRLHMYVNGNYKDAKEASGRLRHRFEWEILKKSGRILPWQDFEVIRMSRMPG